MESSKDEAETIDVWALMLGLDDTDSADADEISDPGSIHLALASTSTLRIDSLVASDSKHESLSGLNVSHQGRGRGRQPRRSMVYNNPEECGRQYPPAAQAVIQDDCGSMEEEEEEEEEEGSSSSVLFGDEASLFLSGNPVAYDENEISPRSVSRRFRFKAGSMGSKHGKRAPDYFLGTTTTTTSLSGEGETPTSPSTAPYSSSTSGGGAGAGGLLKQWFQRSSREKKHSSPAGFKSLFRESRPTKSSDQFESLEANNANSRAWHSFSNVNRNQQLIRENVLQPTTTATTSSSNSTWEEVEKSLNDSSVKMTTLYTTNDRAEADAYEDCNAARAILISLVGTSFDEKSISLHPYHELELKNALNIPMAEVLVVPTLYVGGEYVVGIDNIMQLYKKGKLGSLLLDAALPHGLKRDSLCTCRGGRFLVCPLCKGKGKLSRKGQESMRCRHCSATGLLKCPNCLYS